MERCRGPVCWGRVQTEEWAQPHPGEGAGVVGVPLHARLLVHLGMETTKSSRSAAMSQEN